MSDTYQVTLAEVIDLLNQRWDGLVEDLIPGIGNNGSKGAGQYTIGNLRGDVGKSLVLWRKHRAGAWKDYSTDESGDAIILIEKLVFGGSGVGVRGKAIAWAKQWLGIEKINQAEFYQRKQSAARATKNRARKAEDERQRFYGKAKAIFIGAVGDWSGSILVKYFAGRGVDVTGISNLQHAICFEPACYCVERKAKLPAMICSIHMPNTGGLMAIHRTYLEVAADGVWRKAALQNPKMTLGEYKGGYIPLWRGKTGKKIDKMGPDEELVITEGVEDGETMIMVDPARPVVVAVSLFNMACLVLPDAVKRVLLVKDTFMRKAHRTDAENDRLERLDRLAFDKACAFHIKAGRVVRKLIVPDGFKDVNDWLAGSKQG